MNGCLQYLPELLNTLLAKDVYQPSSSWLYSTVSAGKPNMHEYIKTHMHQSIVLDADMKGIFLGSVCFSVSLVYMMVTTE